MRGEEESTRRDGFGHQPPDPADLAQHPPADARCADVRARLRDYADGDLDAVRRRGVDEHVHGCRSCALALARAELEVFRLRRAFQEDRDALETPPADFTARVMRAVEDVVLAEGEGPSREFTGRVMEQVRREWRGRPTFRQRLSRASVAVVLLPGLAIAALAAAAVWVLDDNGPRRAGFTVADARGAWLGSEGEREPLMPGRVLPDAAPISTSLQGGFARLAWQAGDGDQGRAGSQIEVWSGTDVTIGSREAALAIGALYCQGIANWRLDLRHAGESVGEIEVPERATFYVSLEPVERHDRALWPHAVPRGMIEVETGSLLLRRGDGEALHLLARQVARFEAWEPVAVDRAPDPRSLRPRTTLDEREPQIASDAPPVWRGRIVDALRGSGVPGATVRVTTAGGVHPVTTDPEGFYAFADRAGLALVEVEPSQRLRGFGPEPFDLRRLGGDIVPVIALDEAPRISGWVYDSQGSPVAEAIVETVVLDEVFDHVERVGSLTTDAHGRFHLVVGVAEPERGRRLLTIVRHAEHPAVVRPLQVGEAQPFDVRFPEVRQIALGGLAAGPHVLLREVPGLPLSAGAEWLAVEADVDGRTVAVACGPGRLWLLDEAAGALRALLEEASGWRVGEPGEGLPAPDYVQPLPEGAARGLWLTVGQRFGRVHGVAAGQDSRYIFVHDLKRPAVQDVHVHVELPDGAIEFLGISDGVRGLEFVPPAERPFRLIALGPGGGEVGVLGSTEFDAFGYGSIPVAAPGGVAFDEALRPVLESADGRGMQVAFELLDGPLQGRTWWRTVETVQALSVAGLVPGSYRVRMPRGEQASCHVEPGRAVTVAAPTAAEPERAPATEPQLEPQGQPGAPGAGEAGAVEPVPVAPGSGAATSGAGGAGAADVR